MLAPSHLPKPRGGRPARQAPGRSRYSQEAAAADERRWRPQWLKAYPQWLAPKRPTSQEEAQS